MKKLVLSILTIIAFHFSANAQVYEWAKRIGGAGYDFGKSITIDASGNVYSTGYFEGTVDFDPGTGTANLTSVGGRDVFISKLDSLGNFLWAKSIGGTRFDFGISITIDVSGNVYTTGFFNGTVDFDPGTGTSNLTSTGYSDVFISKLDSLGNFLWAKSFLGTGFEDVKSITTDVSGNVYTTGSFYGTVDFDPGTGTSNLASAGSNDVFISKLDSLGNFSWVKRFGRTDHCEGFSITIDASGNVYTTGRFYGTVDFDPGTGTSNLASAGYSDIFISKLDSLGNLLWVKSMGGIGSDEGMSITTDVSGNVYTTGSFYGTVDFDPGTGTSNLTSPGVNNIFILKLDSSGIFLWAKSMGGIGSSNLGYSTAIDVSGNVYTTGYFFGTVDFDPGIGISNLTSAGSSDVFISKLDSSGNFSWAKSMGSTSIDEGYSIAIDVSGNVYTTGYFNGTVDFDPGTGVSNLTSVGFIDIFISKLSPCLPITGIDNQTACNTYTWINGNTYTSSNNSASHTLTSASGCDSVVTLNLTVNYSNSGTDTQIVCNTYTWIDGNTYTSSNNTATDTLTNASGCDSVVTLDLTVNYSSTRIDTQVACNTYTWIDGNTYTTSNNAATYTLTNAAGCDSVVTLNLSINSNTGIDTQTACDTYTWIDGNTYSTSNNTATHTLTNAAGCDSVVTLNLSINSNTGTDPQAACSTYTWIDGNTYTTSNNTATYTLTNAAGCDSVVTLNLSINSNTGIDTQAACNTYTWIDGNSYTTSNNTATYTLTNASGCDSVVTLDLTVNYSNTGMDTQAACDSYVWIDGNTYTTSNNTAMHTITNAAGCDSVVTLDLTVNYSSTRIDTQVACNTYTWIDGNTYTTSNNTSTHTLTNAAGCDSVVTLNLSINSNTGIDTQAACDSYVWIDGNTYTTSNNTATYTLTNAAGCDSVVTLNLSINSNTGTDTQAACDSYTWIDGITYTTSNNTATHTLTNAAGCDSVVTLNLTINTIDVTVSITSPTITANTAGATYQWLDCNNSYAQITGETSQSYTATANGSYAVEITENGCTDTSACVAIINIGINEVEYNSIKIYPNPTLSKLNIENKGIEISAISIIDISGKIVKTINKNAVTIDVSKLVNGVYFLQIQVGNSVINKKFVKE